MAFKKSLTLAASLESPESLANDLKTRKVAGLLSHQTDVLPEYVQAGVDKPDIAIQLPTGSGKTYVGLLIAEWRRRKFGERAVYLCPTRQLVYQVVEQLKCYAPTEGCCGEDFLKFRPSCNPLSSDVPKRNVGTEQIPSLPTATFSS